MPNPGTLPISLLTIILLVVPGLLGLDLYYRLAEKSTSLSRVQWIVYSVITSLSSLFLLYFLTFFYLGTVESTSETIAATLGIATVSELSELSVPTFVSLYVFHILVAMGLGAGLGWWKKSEYEDRREPWHYAFDETQQDGEEMEVVTSDGTVIQGEYNRTAWDDSQRELFLHDPYEIIYSADGSKREKKIDLGRSIIVMEESISRVVFIEEDPNQERVSRLAEQEDDEGSQFDDETPRRISEDVPEGLTAVLEDVFGEQAQLSRFSEEKGETGPEDTKEESSEWEIEKHATELLDEERSEEED